jgi:hypothetical protein
LDLTAPAESGADGAKRSERRSGHRGTGARVVRKKIWSFAAVGVTSVIAACLSAKVGEVGEINEPFAGEAFEAPPVCG